MQTLDNLLYWIELFDSYFNLLTKRQVEYFRLHFFDDLSFTEIAEHLNVSKAAAFDGVEKVKKLLLKYEAALNLTIKRMKREQLYLTIEDQELVAKLKELD
ncbi:hypothetical protein JM47_00055 [Ureaplasma diversum]|uniref:UPF0122 protein JM47_00055 n=1 Tax=Ureaplasma diversum TaxID=42094 RepID=A0A0C5S129_9BACT|nr:sigma factor-like helix-turn-helix DNA-binding protein [Ureaplasma diversum]AJQ45075.1 hypothetical protein JM47_00055 [Ureaplasma diversum]